MRRIQCFELEDQPWFPTLLRNRMTEYLLWISGISKLYEPIIPQMVSLLKGANRLAVMDLCGGGGTSLHLKSALDKTFHQPIAWTITDKFPHQEIASYLQIRFADTHFERAVVDVFEPPAFEGVYTLFTALHHFNPQEVAQILGELSKTGQPIGIFEAGSRRWIDVLFVGILPFFALFFLTPFIKPFKWSRLVFTYFLPVLPFCILWDGTVSMLRQYEADELLKLAQKAAPSLDWQCVYTPSKFTRLTSLVGIPKS
jgi:hypothetical protein